MNNLHRELAPISDAAWSQIEEEAARTLKRYLAGRRVVDVPAPAGVALPAVATGHLKPIAAPAQGIFARQREVKRLVELRAPFELPRQAIDDVERGSEDSDWQAVKDAAKTLAFAEDRAIFHGYKEADIQGVREGTSNPIDRLPADIRDYPDAVAHALSQLRLVGVNGPYSVLLGASEYTALAETRDEGYPVLEHVKRIVRYAESVDVVLLRLGQHHRALHQVVAVCDYDFAPCGVVEAVPASPETLDSPGNALR